MPILDYISEPVLRLGIFVAVFAVMASLEAIWPRRVRRGDRTRRWSTNVGLTVMGSVLVRALGALAPPLVATGAAVLASRQGWGLFNALEWPPLATFALTLVVLDFAIWLQHVASHKVPLFWRFHRMHHADIDFDLTTGIRFHPFEIGLSMLYKVAWVMALGAPVAAVVTFEIILNGGAMFSHANVHLPPTLDRWMRFLLVTPDMHRVHHSIERAEHDSNFGFSLSIWDRVFQTYTPQPAAGHLGMTIGLPSWQDHQPTRLWWSLALPWRDGGEQSRRPVEVVKVSTSGGAKHSD